MWTGTNILIKKTLETHKNTLLDLGCQCLAIPFSEHVLAIIFINHLMKNAANQQKRVWSPPFSKFWICNCTGKVNIIYIVYESA